VPIVLIIVGAACEAAAIVLGVFEIVATRKTVEGFLGRARIIYLTGIGRLGSVTGSATLTTDGPRLVPTIDDRVKALEGRIDQFGAQVKTMNEETTENLRAEMEAALKTRDQSIADFNRSVEDFTKRLGDGYWRRVLTVALFLFGLALQTGGGIWSAWPSG